MPFPVFKDFDKSASDIFSEDFDTKYTLKIKSPAPSDVALTTNITYDPSKDSKLTTKISTKWGHSSGFTLEKLELAADGKLTTETSLDGTAPGLKLDFKGNDSDKGDLSFTYKHGLATVTGEVDALAFSKANATICTGHGPFTAGAACDLTLAKSSVSSSTICAGVGYTVPGSLFAGIRAKKNFNEYSGVVTFAAAPNVTLAGKVDYNAKATGGVLAAVYKCNPSTTIKVKANNSGLLNTSVKQQIDKKFVVVGTAEIPSSFNGVKFGVNATLG